MPSWIGYPPPFHSTWELSTGIIGISESKKGALLVQLTNFPVRFGSGEEGRPKIK